MFKDLSHLISIWTSSSHRELNSCCNLKLISSMSICLHGNEVCDTSFWGWEVVNERNMSEQSDLTTRETEISLSLLTDSLSVIDLMSHKTKILIYTYLRIKR